MRKLNREYDRIGNNDFDILHYFSKNGALLQEVNEETGETYEYKYDANGRLIKRRVMLALTVKATIMTIAMIMKEFCAYHQ